MSQFTKFHKSNITMPVGEAISKEYFLTPIISIIGALNIAHLTHHIYGFNYHTNKWERIKAIFIKEVVSKYSFLYFRNFYMRKQSSIFFFDNETGTYQLLMNVKQIPQKGDVNKIVMHMNDRSRPKLATMGMQNDLWVREIDKILPYSANITGVVLPTIEETLATFVPLLEFNAKLAGALIKLFDNYAKVKKQASQVYYNAIFHSFDFSTIDNTIIGYEPISGLEVKCWVSNPKVGTINIPSSQDTSSLVSQITAVRSKINTVEQDMALSTINRVLHGINTSVETKLSLLSVNLNIVDAETKPYESVKLTITYLNRISNEEVTLEFTHK